MHFDSFAAASLMSYELVKATVLADDRLPMLEHKAYALATVKHECANTWEPIAERGSAAYLRRYEVPPVSHWLGNTEPGDGVRFKGRGYVQITGRALYAKFSKLLGLDLVAQPELAETHEHAYRILSIGMPEGRFTGKKLTDYIQPGSIDYVNARRVINSLDKADIIAGYARDFEAELSKAA